MKKYLFLAITLTATFVSMAQDIPQHISYTRIYDFIDELANDGIIEINSVVKPYSRQFISRKLEEAKVAEASLNRTGFPNASFRSLKAKTHASIWCLRCFCIAIRYSELVSSLFWE